jgi:anti-sigma factor RsiW
MENNTQHPSDEELTAFALGEGADAARDHLKTCTQCTAFVEDIRRARTELASVPDEEVPRSLEERIQAARVPRHGRHGGKATPTGLGARYRGTLFIGLAVMALMLIAFLLYALVM